MATPAPIVLVTGASSGIGRALALAWARRGARLVLSARSPGPLAEVADAVRAAGGEALAVPSDVTDDASRRELVRQALAAYGGRLDVLVNNAGRGHYAAALAIEPAELEQTYRLNAVAPLALAQLTIDALAQSRGTIVMISSVVGVVSTPRLGAYASSKFALEGLSVALRAEIASRGVRLLVVRPGPVATPFHQNAVVDEGGVGYRPPGHKAQDPDDVAAMVLRAVDRGDEVLETSLFVKASSAASRLAPAVFRRVARAMARRSGF
jgi:short-subunit dehydrogenase